MEYSIDIAREKDLAAIADCHRAAFPDALTSKMGKRYLRKVFSWYLSTNHTFLFFIKQSNTIIGYCGGMVVDGSLAHGSASSMTQHTFNEGIKALLVRPWLLLHPDFLARYKFFARNILTRIRNRFGKQEIRSAPKPKVPHTGLVVIGVAPAFQGKGYGSVLLKEFERITLERGLSKMILSVNSDNNQAIQSYTRNGWIIANVKGKSTSMEKALIRQNIQPE